MLKPSGLAICHTSMAMEMAKSGRQMKRRLRTGVWSIFSQSATMRRQERKAVSPLVMGAATTPNMANTAPKAPSQSRLTRCTTAGAEVEKPLEPSMRS